MENSKLTKIIKKKNIDTNNINNEDVSSLVEHYIKDDIGTEELISYMKGANVAFQTFVNGLDSFFEKGNYSSNKYTDVLQSLIDDLRVQSKEAITVEEEERIWIKIDKVLDRMKDEADRRTNIFTNLGVMTATVSAVVIGGAVTVATKNPELLKKGIEMIPKKIGK
ncbi:hypothetical protein [Planococcus sp. YIM B11945]|uniref:hypothetical protein n=1 Tax=Planococcus sp. YIM B11945 TaxID=3435410 RepID=UPI003D7E83E0